MRITFVRHGESEANSSGRWQGQGDSPLSALGRAQAARAAARLDVPRFDRIVSSDLQRARDTARATGREPELVPGLREVHVGTWEGLGRAEVLERFPDEISALVRGDDIRIGGGESWSEATARAEAALEALRASAHPDEHLAVFSHGGIITSLFLRFLRGSRRPQPIGHMVNTAISAAYFDEHGVVVERYNDAAHEPENAPHRRRMFGPEAAIIGYLALDDSTDVDALARRASLFGDVVRVVRHPSAPAIAARDLAQALRHDVSAIDAVDVAALTDVHGASTTLVLASSEVVAASIRDATRPMMPEARFARVPEGSLSHIARTKSTCILADYASILIHPISASDMQ